MRKILISGGFGAGWTTWNDKEFKKFALEYKPIIEYLENGGEFVEDRNARFDLNEPQYMRFNEPGRSVLKQFVEDLCKVADDKEEAKGFYLGGARDLRVVEVDGLITIHEYDGSESVVTPDSIDWM